MEKSRESTVQNLFTMQTALAEAQEHLYLIHKVASSDFTIRGLGITIATASVLKTVELLQERLSKAFLKTSVTR